MRELNERTARKTMNTQKPIPDLTSAASGTVDSVREIATLREQLLALQSALAEAERRMLELTGGIKRRIGVALNEPDASQWMMDHIRGMQRFVVEWEKRQAALKESSSGAEARQATAAQQQDEGK